MLIQFLGHACFMIETGGTGIIIDPYLKENPVAAAKTEDIEVQWVLVTHGHSDHLGDAIEIASRNRATIVTNPELARYCGRKEVKTHPLYIGGKRNFGPFSVKMTLALHGSSTGTNPIEYLGQPGGFLIFSEGKTVYHAGDTGLFGDMELIGRLHTPDLAILPIGDNYTMGPEDALEAVRLLKPRQVIPAHYNTWGLIVQDPVQFKTAVEAETGTPVTVLNPGESLVL